MKNYNLTVIACYLGMFSQAIVANFITMLFFMFHESYGVSYWMIALIPSVFFVIQILVDVFCAKYVTRIGQRKCIVASEMLVAAGLLLLAFLPNVLPNSFVGIIIATVVYAMGSGLVEVLVSPIMEACPFDHKDKVMSLLHSFYCWGVVATILIATGFFAIFGIKNWPFMSCIFALVPIVNVFLFSICPIESVTGEEKGLSISSLFKIPSFWVSIILMICAGASEISISQWASAFVESSLHISKTISDLVGPCLFAISMGISRVIYSVCGEKIKLEGFMIVSGLLSLGGYLLTSLSPWSVLSLIGCMLCGFSCGIMWPGTISISSQRIPLGGVSMFAFFAMAGDIGGAIGPNIVGSISDIVGGNLQRGILWGGIFPLILVVAVIVFVYLGKKRQEEHKNESL